MPALPSKASRPPLPAPSRTAERFSMSSQGPNDSWYSAIPPLQPRRGCPNGTLAPECAPDRTTPSGAAPVLAGSPGISLRAIHGTSLRAAAVGKRVSHRQVGEDRGGAPAAGRLRIRARRRDGPRATEKLPIRPQARHSQSAGLQGSRVGSRFPSPGPLIGRASATARRSAPPSPRPLGSPSRDRSSGGGRPGTIRRPGRTGPG